MNTLIRLLALGTLDKTKGEIVCLLTEYPCDSNSLSVSLNSFCLSC